MSKEIKENLNDENIIPEEKLIIENNVVYAPSAKYLVRQNENLANKNSTPVNKTQDYNTENSQPPLKK